MAAKRPAPESSATPPPKRSALALAPLDIGPAAGEEDLDIKVLKVFQIMRTLTIAWWAWGGEGEREREFSCYDPPAFLHTTMLAISMYV